MLRKIVYTFQTSLASAFTALLTVWLTVRFLGAEGRGVISLFLINISVIQIFTSIVGGAGLVYLVPRYGVSRVFFPSLAWAIICSLLGSFLMEKLSLVQSSFFIHTIVLSFFQAIILNNLQILIAKDRVSVYNFCRLLQPAMVFAVFGLQLMIQSHHSVSLFFNSLYVSFTIVLCISSFFTFKGERFSGRYFEWEVISTFFHVGGLNELNNIMQLANGRFSFYIVEKTLGVAALGIFSLAISLTEAVWMFGRSISTIHHSEVSRKEESGLKNNEKLIKMSFLGTLTMLIIALLLPARLYREVFGLEFKEIKCVILLLAPGVIALSGAMVISHYFSAIKKIHFNTVSSAIGSLIIIVCSLMLVPQMGIHGAALANSLSWITTSLIIFFQYRKLKKVYSGSLSDIS
ncbi:lipopolysaccharide biosynthesis protein [Desertivirga xinjiangensis]|uniref:lipopolysaccharide biosynthesis protein n=1 Tax=Desertivirga xinjiangensis TaxID=539206 RepID=UPI00210B3AA8|nr:polysaccharide biosynthesis C-terminal domain-containing protein [Pedobacter xinjiangensis]